MSFSVFDRFTVEIAENQHFLKTAEIHTSTLCCSKKTIFRQKPLEIRQILPDNLHSGLVKKEVENDKNHENPKKYISIP